MKPETADLLRQYRDVAPEFTLVFEGLDQLRMAQRDPTYEIKGQRVRCPKPAKRRLSDPLY